MPADGSDAAVAAPAARETAVLRIVEALDQVAREISIARDTIDWCEDYEGTAYHLRRALAHVKFASGVLADLKSKPKI